MGRRFARWVWIPILLGSTAGFAAAGEERRKGPTAAQYGVVLNLAGRQRMLTQRMSAQVLMIALDVNRSEALMELENTSSLFGTTLKGLRKGSRRLRLPKATTKPVLDQLAKIEKRWTDFDVVVQAVLAGGYADASQVRLVAKENPRLLADCDRLVQIYAKEARDRGMLKVPPLANVIDLAGRQRMLTQKMSKEFFLVAMDMDAEENRKAMAATVALFQKTLNGLLDGDASLGLPATKDAKIKLQLLAVHRSWRTFRSAIDKALTKGWEAPEEDLLDVADRNVTLLAEMHKAVKLFELAAANAE